MLDIHWLNFIANIIRTIHIDNYDRKTTRKKNYIYILKMVHVMSCGSMNFQIVF
jgi:hypothetical protein